MTQESVTVTTGSHRLIHIVTKQALQARRGLRVANGIHEVEEAREFRILLTNFSAREQSIPKNTVVAYAVQENVLFIGLEGEGATQISQDLALHVKEPTECEN